MKQTFRKFILSFICMFMCGAVSAVEVTIDGIVYDVITKAKQATLIDGKSCSGNVVIPETIHYDGVDYSVTSIRYSAFWGCRDLTSVSIPNSVVSIGSQAFEYCTGLTKAEFASIESLCNISFSNSFANPLYSAHNLYIDGKEVKEIAIPNNVTTIGEYTFSGCTSLNSVTIDNSVTSIGYCAFSDCSGLNSVTIGNSVTSIGQLAFEGCSSLTSITIGSSVSSIGKSAFRNCSALTTIIIPKGVTSIREYTFERCSSLTSVTIPNSVTSIESGAFLWCSGFTSVTIPNSVTSIGTSAFYGCSSLNSVTIGSGVTSIENGTFKNCPELNEVYCLSEKVPSMGYDVFNGSYVEYCTLHVPSASVDSYKSADQWKNFGKIVAIEDDVPTIKTCAEPTIEYTNGKIVCTSETEGAVCHYSYTIIPTTVSGDGTDSGIINAVNGKIEVTAYATAEGYEASESVTETFDYKTVAGSCDVNGDGKVDMQDANIVVNTFLGK